MTKYQNRPVLVEAEQLTEDNMDAVNALAGDALIGASGVEPQIIVRNQDLQDVTVQNGEYLVRLQDGTFMGMSAGDFEAQFVTEVLGEVPSLETFEAPEPEVPTTTDSATTEDRTVENELGD